MATVRTDPDSFTEGVEITTNTTTRRVTFNNAGNLAGAKLSGRAYYSWTKEEWIAVPGRSAYPWPIEMITPEQGRFVSDWEPINDASRSRLATVGWEEVTSSGAVKRRYCGVVSTPPDGVAADAQPYYAQGTGAPVDFAWPGPVNEAVQTFGDVNNGNFDRRTSDILVYCREEQSTYAVGSVFTNYTLDTLGTDAYRVGITVGANDKATVADVGIDANADGTADVAPFSGMVFTSHTSPVAIAMAGGTYNFTYTIDCNGGTIQQGAAYWWWLQRKSTDIDAHATNTLTGKTSARGVYYVGDKLYTTLLAPGKGLAFTNFAAAGINYVTFSDDTDAARTFAYTAAGTIETTDAAQADATAVYYLYPTAEYGAPGATLVDDANGDPITGLVDGDASISFTYDHTAGGDLAVTCVLLGTSGCTSAIATTTLVASESNKVVPANAIERNYLNPA
jgi:hypothetical protein